MKKKKTWKEKYEATKAQAVEDAPNTWLMQKVYAWAERMQKKQKNKGRKY